MEYFPLFIYLMFSGYGHRWPLAAELKATKHSDICLNVITDLVVLFLD